MLAFKSAVLRTEPGVKVEKFLSLLEEIKVYSDALSCESPSSCAKGKPFFD